MTPFLTPLRRVLDRLAAWPWVRFVLIVYTRYGEHNGPLLAAGLVFFLILALIPLLLLAVACLGYYLQGTGTAGNAAVTVEHWLRYTVLPGISGDAANHIIRRANVAQTIDRITRLRSVSGIAGFLGLLWASMQLFVTGSVAMNAAWNVKESRSWIGLRLIALCLLVGTGALMGLSIAATTAGTIWERYVPSLVVTAGTELAAFVANFVMYALIYRNLPSTHVTVRAASFGALIASVMWEVAKKAIAIYFVHSNMSLYGGMAGVYVLLLWLYYSMMIFLLGAEASAEYARENEGGEGIGDTVRKA